MKFGMKRNEAGFSLVELMIVVGIIGILASLAMPKMQIFMAKARQSEAKGILANVFALQQSYVVENNTYGSTLADIGYSASGNTKAIYEAGAPSDVTASTFKVQANLKSGKYVCGTDGTDTWETNQNGGATQPSGQTLSCN